MVTVKFFRGGFLRKVRYYRPQDNCFNQRNRGIRPRNSGISFGRRIYDDKKIKLLKFAAVYGANASGKSNLVRALDFMKKTVVHGLPSGYSTKYCKVNMGNKERPSYFEIEVKLGEKYYSYGYEVL